MTTFINTHPKVKAEDIERIEQAYRINLPKEYRDHLFVHNGGVPNPGIFSFREGEEITQSRVHFFYAINSGSYDDITEAINAYKKDEKRMPTHIFPVAEDPFGNVICISLGSKDYGYIYFWDHEKEIDYLTRGDDDYSNLYLVAKDFKSFLENLTDK